MPWQLTGNNGINPTTDFLGTTDDQPLAIRTNGSERMRITPDGFIKWGKGSVLSWDQGGSLELGGDSSTPGAGTPYIDFHFRGLTQDFNTRIINDADGRLTIAANTLRANGDIDVAGDVRLSGADCAEDFDLSGAERIEPGTVVVIDEEGALQQSHQAYDKRVAGVISGAGDYKAGIILDKRESEADRMPVALMGKAYCKVDAGCSPVEVGDLLTTSPTPGHAMKADDPGKAFGAVIGKALQGLTGGQSLVAVLVSLQ